MCILEESMILLTGTTVLRVPYIILITQLQNISGPKHTNTTQAAAGLLKSNSQWYILLSTYTYTGVVTESTSDTLTELHSFTFSKTSNLTLKLCFVKRKSLLFVTFHNIF